MESERVVISVHVVRRYRQWRARLGLTGTKGLSDYDEIAFLIALAEPCHGISEGILRSRTRRHGPAKYLHAGIWRFVVNGQGVLCTVEPDLHEGEDPGVWREVKEALGQTPRSGFTVREITRGLIKRVSQKGG
jgi:hypothetical protein